MDRTAQQNTLWQFRVRKALMEGYGCEDIADKECCPLEDVRTEIGLLRQEGFFDHIYSKMIKFGPTVQRLTVKPESHIP